MEVQNRITSVFKTSVINKRLSKKIRKENRNMHLINKKIVMAKDIGIHGNLFGGILMAWIDEAAAAYATEYCYKIWLLSG